ncbi:hypothetical protein MCC01947_17580 [Bifidobacteriaceae bacterium MCC01947]|nr:hypothetical protein MCC01943_01710 [Bifidobacteriaceae bacterium MCC01943]GDY98483.1 hypothetical protein MCC01947_17580 [Bifidobacteriaceae bacterium MCC01947]GDZ01902.1 hypothetical protein MCC01941_11530 [Bifidobacteriaceae bacterium MCC01941]
MYGHRYQPAAWPGTTDPPLTLRGKPDNGTCPAMPMRGGAGKRSGAQARRHPLFSFGPFAYGKDRNRLHVRATRSGPQGIRRARGRSDG